MSVPPAIDLESLLREERWMRRLARRLVTDPNEADGVVLAARFTGRVHLGFFEDRWSSLK